VKNKRVERRNGKMVFTGNAVGKNPSLIPQQQVVIPPITIPQGFTAQPQTPLYTQLTARGKEGAKKIPMAPGSNVAIFEEDPEKDIFYRRSIDEYGNEGELEAYAYTKIEDPPEPEYLTKQEFYSAMDEFFMRLKEENANGNAVCAKTE
jgi:hypothetical protein